MGSWFSRGSSDVTTNKGVQQSTSTNITVQESIEVHNDLVVILLIIITIILVIHLVIKICARQKQRMLRKHQSRQILNSLAARHTQSTHNDDTVL